MSIEDYEYASEIDRVLDRFSVRDGDGVRLLKEDLDVREMLVRFAEPLNGLFGSLTTRYAVAVFAWNLSIAPEEHRDELMAEFVDPLVEGNEEGRQTLRELITSLIDRRDALYPDESLLILPTEDPEEEIEYEGE